MRYNVNVKFSSDGRLVIDGSEITVSIESAPERGKANAELVKKLARHFGVHPSQVMIVSGTKSRKKTVEIIADRP
jgi:uncharacterized protein (TIGR00251 family)